MTDHRTILPATVSLTDGPVGFIAHRALTTVISFSAY